MSFKYRIINNGRQYLANSVEEYIRSSNYRGESLQIEAAPRDGWFDTNGNRCVRTRFGLSGERLETTRIAKVASWEYSEEFEYEDVHTLAYLAKKGLLDKDNIAISEGGNVPIICTYPDEFGTSTNILLDITGKDEHIVRRFSKRWKGLISVI